MIDQSKVATTVQHSGTLSGTSHNYLYLSRSRMLLHAQPAFVTSSVSDNVDDLGLVHRETRDSSESKRVDIGYTKSGSAVGLSYWIMLIASQVLLLTIYMTHLRAAAHPTGYHIRLSQAVSFVNDGS
jgi:hypothetical protein